MIGLIIDTNNLTGGIPPDYIAEVLDLINTTWHSHRHCFTAGETTAPEGTVGWRVAHRTLGEGGSNPSGAGVLLRGWGLGPHMSNQGTP